MENGFRGNSFPVIVADATICKELRLLESEFDEEAFDVISEDQIYDSERPRSREAVLHFLNELGWLFQRRSSVPVGSDYSLSRFKFLFTFCVERDCCALVEKLLDILVERNVGEDGLSSKSLEALLDIQLLNRAVKRRYRKMVDLLIHYSVTSRSSTKYIFPPNLVGAGGITPLHLAACTSGSEGIIDALTSDPQEVLYFILFYFDLSNDISLIIGKWESHLYKLCNILANLHQNNTKNDLSEHSPSITKTQCHKFWLVST